KELAYKKTPSRRFPILWILSDLSAGLHILSEISLGDAGPGKRAVRNCQEMPLAYRLSLRKLSRKICLF
ncbi:hypothetical protein SB761_36540, partial [Pseudomonas sp. SIMBA_064]